MAVTFHLPDGSRTDISMQTSPRFPVRDPAHFIELVKATKPDLGMAVRMPAFFARHPGAMRAALSASQAARPPSSYASCRYYAIHAFRWIAPDGGERYVRYSWIPEQEEDRLSMREARKRGRDYLQEDLVRRLADGTLSFTLQLQLAGPEHDPDDPTADWGDEAETLSAGTLDVTRVDASAERDGEVVVFDPARVTEGIELSGDPILAYRPRAYSESVDRRTR
jgi:catalase